MGQIVGLKFKDQGQVYYFNSSPFVVNVGDEVLVKTEEGQGLGKVVTIKSEPPADISREDLKSIFRIATEEDRQTAKESWQLARQAFAYCKKCIRERELEMKLVDVDVYFDRSKMIFYFTAPGRIDFRELVKDLVKEYKTRIELRQIGVRHETQMLGGLGNCGQVCCCRRYLRRFEPVTIKMAKEQNLFLNPAKISGVCGRLLCCLSYEQENYTRFQKRCPKLGKSYSTTLGKVKLLRANIFRDSLVVLTDSGEEREMSLEEWEHVVTKQPDQVAHASSPERQEQETEKKKSPGDKEGISEKKHPKRSRGKKRPSRAKPKGRKKRGPRQKKKPK